MNRVEDALLSAVVQKIVDYSTSKEFINFFLGQKLDESLLKKLKITVLALSKVLNDAENKQFTDPNVKDWLNELKDAIHDAEDLLDKIAAKALQCEVEAQNPRGQKTFQDALISAWNWLLGSVLNFTSEETSDMNSKLEEIIGLLDHFLKTKDALGLREVAGQN